ncbi:MAG: hypothetical protein OEW64_03815 [Gammaproteobacteria bacterium]|nr:hypothetical protein [Gammaproteobacteria bacterium]MDH5303205.1 hypothetical protein [Gammaproteobacteria bacterium]MDH5322262.1 hypothetical protein [Gammaproteobacteria bacterium]
MSFELCESRGFDAQAIDRRLRQTGLAGPELHAQAEVLQTHVIMPNCDAIIDGFFEAMLAEEDFNAIVSQYSDHARLKDTQKNYIKGMGIGFDRRR